MYRFNSLISSLLCIIFLITWFCLQEEDDCSYFLRSGHCKFGGACKFNHPQSQSTNLMVSLRGSPVYSALQSPTGQQSWPRASFVANPPRWQDPSSFTSLVLPQGGVVSVQGWNAYSVSLFLNYPSSFELFTNWFSFGTGHCFPQGQLDSLSPLGKDQNYRNQQQNDAKESLGSQGGLFSSGLHSGNSVPLGFYALPRENVFPERPGQHECQFYMKTGDCKFGTVCKYHHPRDRQIPAPDCVLSPVGLPLRSVS